MTDDEFQERRRASRRDRRAAGERSAQLARGLMGLAASELAEVELDEELRDAVLRARKVSSPIARRRAERSLAGELRRYEIDELEAALARVREGGGVETRRFQLAERWRARLIDEGMAAADELPGGPTDELAALVERARRERATGKPRGAARALFRHLRALLEAQDRPAGEPPA